MILSSSPNTFNGLHSEPNVIDAARPKHGDFEMQDLTSFELQNIDGGSWSDVAWAAAFTVAVLAAPFELPLAAVAVVGVSLLT